MAGLLAVEVFLAPYKPFVGASKSWDSGQQPTWPASTATLVEGAQDAVLVDGLMTLAEGEELLAWVQRSGKRLSSVYVTHAHADHFYGLEPVLRAFPETPVLTHPEIAAAAVEQVDAGHQAVWESFFPGQIAAQPVTPVAMAGDTLELEEHTLSCVYLGQSDVERSSVVHVSELDAVVAGDVAYNGIHMWLAGSDPKSRAAWIESLDAIERLRPTTVIAGHKDPDAPDDDAGRVLDASRQYIRDFDGIVANSETAKEIIAKMLAKYPDLGNRYTLTFAADTQRP
ncbi:MBL fold metallo-hydrolase [Kribbella sp. NPDC055071]